MRAQKQHVTEALRLHQATLSNIMTQMTHIRGGKIRAIPLSSEIPYKGKNHTHVTVEGYLSGDNPYRTSPLTLVHFSPELDFTLHKPTETTLGSGIRTRVAFHRFGLSHDLYHLAVSGDRAILDRFLIPARFAVARIVPPPKDFELVEHEPVPLHTRDLFELGKTDQTFTTQEQRYSQLAALTISVTCDAIDSLGFARLARENNY